MVCDPLGAEIPQFTGLGDLPGGSVASSALAISGDGSTVVGSSSSALSGEFGEEAFVWTLTTGMVGLGDLPGGHRWLPFSSWASGVSEDGSIVVGTGMSEFQPGDGGEEAFRWTERRGMVGLRPAVGSAFVSGCTGVSDDGAVMVGWRCCNPNYEAFRLTADGELVVLGALGGPTMAIGATAISADGSTIVGYSGSPNSYPPSTTGEPFRWTEGEGVVGLGFLPGGLPIGEAYGVSADGQVVVGRSNSAQGAEHAFLWTSVTGMIGLGDLPGGAFGSVAYGVSADGSRVVGVGRTALGDEAFLWEQGIGMQRLQDVLAERLGLDLDGWTLQFATAITPDGRVVTGWGVNPSGDREAWVARLGLLGDLNADGIIDGADLGLLLGAWNGDGPADLNGDGVVDGADLGVLLGGWTAR